MTPNPPHRGGALNVKDCFTTSHIESQFRLCLFGSTFPSFRSIRPTLAFSSLPSSSVSCHLPPPPGVVRHARATSNASVARRKKNDGRIFSRELTRQQRKIPMAKVRRRRGQPYLAVITEPDACNGDGRVEETFKTIRRAVSAGGVDLVSIRVTNSRRGDDDEGCLVALIFLSY